MRFAMAIDFMLLLTNLNTSWTEMSEPALAERQHINALQAKQERRQDFVHSHSLVSVGGLLRNHLQQYLNV